MNAISPALERKPVDDLVTLPYPKFHSMDGLEWNPWVMDGVEYKLVSVDDRTNGFSIFLRVAPNTIAPVHRHMGSIELLVLEGDLTYDGVDIGRAGDYMYEPAGDVHRPKSPSGCILFAVFNGPIAALDDDGNIVGIVDGKAMRELAAAHKATKILDQA
jgi:anti-sigma factor ChrR (cupin superfamily)